jgi:fermentation-respiration switch protein FrsA (DUF1100 family)
VVVPHRFGAKLFAAAPEPKTALIEPGAGHFDLYGRELFERGVAAFVERLE